MTKQSDTPPRARQMEKESDVQHYINGMSGNYIRRAINIGVRNKQRAPFKAPAEAKLKAAIRKLYDKTPGALVSAIPGVRSAGRNGLFDVRFALADGSTSFDFTDASKAMQDGQSVRVQIWECKREPKSWWQTEDFSSDEGEFVMHAEKVVALTPRDFEKHAR